MYALSFDMNIADLKEHNPRRVHPSFIAMRSADIFFLGH